MLRILWEASAIGLEMALALGIGYIGGSFLDSKFHSTPWLKWIGFGAGIGASILALVRITKQYKKFSDEK